MLATAYWALWLRSCLRTKTPSYKLRALKSFNLFHWRSLQRIQGHAGGRGKDSRDRGAYGSWRLHLGSLGNKWKIMSHHKRATDKISPVVTVVTAGTNWPVTGTLTTRRHWQLTSLYPICSLKPRTVPLNSDILTRSSSIWIRSVK